MSAATVTMTRCPCGETQPRPITDPCPAPGCGRMVPGQGEHTARPELVRRLPSRIDPTLPHTSALVAAALASGGHDG